MFTTLSKLVGRGAAIALMLTGLSLATIVALALILIQLLGEKPVIDGLSCQLGFSKDCLAQELKQERQKLKTLNERTAKLETLYERLAALDHAASSYSVFYHDYKGWKAVTTGIAFKSLLDPSQLTNGWCYVSLGDVNSLQRNLEIATLDKHKRVTFNTLSDAVLRKLGVRPAQITAALKRCQWPEGATGGAK